MGMSLGGTMEALLLVALGIGYMVLYLANREEKNLKAVGYFIGIFIIAVSGIIILNSLLWSVKISKSMGMLPRPRMMMKGQMPSQPVPAQPQK